jgi:hypothetical protein
MRQPSQQTYFYLCNLRCRSRFSYTFIWYLSTWRTFAEEFNLLEYLSAPLWITSNLTRMENLQSRVQCFSFCGIEPRILLVVSQSVRERLFSGKTHVKLLERIAILQLQDTEHKKVSFILTQAAWILFTAVEWGPEVKVPWINAVVETMALHISCSAQWPPTLFNERAAHCLVWLNRRCMCIGNTARPI